MPFAPAAGMSDAARPPKLLDLVRLAIRSRHYSRRTEEAYVGWIRRYILFHGKRHPREIGEREVAAFLMDLSGRRKVAGSTHNQAMSALLFLYREVLEQGPEWGSGLVPALRPVRLPVVLTRQEVAAVLHRLPDPVRLVCELLYGGGLRLLEGLRLRVKDIDPSRGEIRVRDGKGRRDRVTVLPRSVVTRLGDHLDAVRQQHEADLQAGHGTVALSDGLEIKYPSANQERAWQWVFPATRHYRDAITGERRRHHLHESVVQRRFHGAVLAADISKRASCHTLRHHADSRIMPTALRHETGVGGDRAFANDVVGIIRGVRERRGGGRVVGSDPASRRSAPFAPAPAL
jgi:integron integrase